MKFTLALTILLVGLLALDAVSATTTMAPATTAAATQAANTGTQAAATQGATQGVTQGSGAAINTVCSVLLLVPALAVFVR